MQQLAFTRDNNSIHLAVCIDAGLNRGFHQTGDILAQRAELPGLGLVDLLERFARKMLVKEFAGFDELAFLVFPGYKQNAVLDIAIWGHNYQQHPLVRQTNEFDLMKGLGAFGSSEEDTSELQSRGHL